MTQHTEVVNEAVLCGQFMEFMELRSKYLKLGSQWSTHNHYSVYYRKHQLRVRPFYPMENEAQTKLVTTLGFHSNGTTGYACALGILGHLCSPKKQPLFCSWRLYPETSYPLP